MSSSVAFSWRSLFRSLSLSVPLTLVFFDNVAYIARVDGVSMQPTLNEEIDPIPVSADSNLLERFFYRINNSASSDLVLLSHWATRNYNIERGHVVSLISPKNPNQIIIKRVIALEGDTVITRKNQQYERIRIPKGHCWVEGDNHSKSMDSNTFGPVAVGLITAQAKYVIWPPQRWRSLPNKMPGDRIINIQSYRQYIGSYSSGHPWLVDLKDNHNHNSYYALDNLPDPFDELHHY